MSGDPAPMAAAAPAPQDDAISISIRRILCLGLVAGYVDALGFVHLAGIYTGAMTGNTIQLGITVAGARWAHALLVAATLAAFFCGALLSSYIRRRLPSPPLELILMASLLLCAQVVRLVTAHPLPIELPLLAISMAMQGETISRFGGTSLQTIVVTNNLIKLADAIVGRLLSRGGQTDSADIVLPACAWTGCAVGACTGALAAFHLPLPLVPPALLLVLTTLDLLGFPMRRQASRV